MSQMGHSRRDWLRATIGPRPVVNREPFFCSGICRANDRVKIICVRTAQSVTSNAADAQVVAPVFQGASRPQLTRRWQ